MSQTATVEKCNYSVSPMRQCRDFVTNNRIMRRYNSVSVCHRLRRLKIVTFLHLRSDYQEIWSQIVANCDVTKSSELVAKFDGCILVTNSCKCRPYLVYIHEHTYTLCFQIFALCVGTVPIVYTSVLHSCGIPLRIHSVSQLGAWGAAIP